jgi:hypothetical protein
MGKNLGFEGIKSEYFYGIIPEIRQKVRVQEAIQGI